MRLAFLLAVFLASCASPNPGADQIQIRSNTDAVRGCQNLGQQTTTSSGLPAGTVSDNAIIQMRNKAVEIGGTHVISAGPAIAMPGPVATMTGDIYRCVGRR